MSNIIVFEFKGIQYIYGKNNILTSTKIEKNTIKTNKILLYYNKTKFLIGTPYIKGINLKLNLFFIKKNKKKIIKFKKRKRYKIIKNILIYSYKFLIQKIKWQKKKQ
ncbi:bL21 family ribosomal protein [Candidatus Vidania fulgoroideorum]